MPAHTFKSRFTTNFEYIKANSAKTNNFTVLYLHGLCSNPWGRKPESIKSYCLEKGLGFARFELAGHGSDIENYAKSDINVWKSQMLEMIDDIISEPVLLVGMSVGGWLALLGGILRPRRVVGIVGISAAPDFTIGLEEEYMSAAQKQELQEKGQIFFHTDDYDYLFTKGLLDSGRENRLLDKEIKLSCPVQLIQGIKDAAYPWKYSLEIVKQISHDNVVLKLRKGSSHRMQEDGDIAEILNSIEFFLE